MTFIPHHALYKTETGASFVPTEDMLNVHEKSRAPLAAGKRPPISAIARAAVRSPEQIKSAFRPGFREHVRHSEIFKWRKKYRAHDWFDSWLLRGTEPPAEIQVVTRNQIQHCAKAWDWRSFCKRAGFVRQRYTEWLQKKNIPNAEWLKWLYGGPPPEGVFVLDPALQRLRLEKSRKRICHAAGISETVSWLWNNNPLKKQALEEALRAAASSGKTPTSLSASPAWSSLTNKTQKCMWRFAKAATLAACCKRAGISVERYYTFLRRTADLGVKEILERYLEGEERRRWGRLAGPIGENFFVPSENMLAFRREATQEAARQNIRFFKELPGFENWFLDSVIPRTFSGRRFKFSELIPGAAQDGHTEEKTDQSQVQRASVTTGRRGRKKGWRDPGAIDRDKRMIDAWKGGQFDTPAELGRVFKVDKSYAYKLVRSLRASGK